MALFLTGLSMVLIFGLAYVGPRLLDFTLVYDAMAQVANAVGMDPDTFIRFFPIAGASLMVLGNYRQMMGKVKCDNCGWEGPRRQFISGCKECGSKKYYEPK
jgi:hypothetical protein